MGFNPMQKPITMYSDFTPLPAQQAQSDYMTNQHTPEPSPGTSMFNSQMSPAFAPTWMQAGYNSLQDWQAAQNQTQLGATAPVSGPVIPPRF